MSPDHSPLLIPNLSAMTLQSRHPSSQPHGIPNPLLFSHVYQAPAPAFPLPPHAEPRVPGPSTAGPTMHVHGRHVPQTTLRHHPLYSTSVPTLGTALQVSSPQVRLPNI